MTTISGLCIDAHGRPPSAGAAGRINQEVAKPFQPVVVTPVDLRSNKPEEEDLTLVGVA